MATILTSAHVRRDKRLTKLGVNPFILSSNQARPPLLANIISLNRQEEVVLVWG